MEVLCTNGCIITSKLFEFYFIYYSVTVVYSSEFYSTKFTGSYFLNQASKLAEKIFQGYNFGI